MEEGMKKVEGGVLNVSGFSPASSTPVFWKSRRRSVNVAAVRNIDKAVDGLAADKTVEKQPTSDASPADKSLENLENASAEEMQLEPNSLPNLSEKRKALFEPLEPVTNVNGKRPSAESLLPPPDFESASYPRGWLIGKKRKLVNVDVVESMRRIAVQEMNRKDREIDGLNEQLEEDARCLEHLQIQLLEERSKRAEVERQNNVLQNQITMLMDMLQENDAVEDDEEEEDQGP
ncbi:protein HEADING DATE REPRESSOR 1 isoform X1 [Andrographis paniculata]|uniref:protein HEADING DATE REPRESSOR 1 isoform X1 n=1 Tax=Andrographis paniculata TaxID=175694 RepID=UPI0021E90326|nr:protein HEADING DATE REPRESSOR 1 isoform X1 [Andrographis paniculata]